VAVADTAVADTADTAVAGGIVGVVVVVDTAVAVAAGIAVGGTAVIAESVDDEDYTIDSLDLLGREYIRDCLVEGEGSCWRLLTRVKTCGWI